RINRRSHSGADNRSSGHHCRALNSASQPSALISTVYRLSTFPTATETLHGFNCLLWVFVPLFWAVPFILNEAIQKRKGRHGLNSGGRRVRTTDQQLTPRL